MIFQTFYVCVGMLLLLPHCSYQKHLCQHLLEEKLKPEIVHGKDINDTELALNSATFKILCSGFEYNEKYGNDNIGEEEDEDDDEAMQTEEHSEHERVKRSPLWGGGSRSSSRGSSSSRSSGGWGGSRSRGSSSTSSRSGWGGSRSSGTSRISSTRTSSGRKSGGWWGGSRSSSSSSSSKTPKKPSSTWDKVHTALDVGGMVPGLGAVPDAVNAGLHAIRGNWKEAGLSAAAIVPGLGQGVTATKLGAKALSKIDKINSGAKVVRSFAKKKGTETVKESATSSKAMKALFEKATGKKHNGGVSYGKTADGRTLTFRDKSKTGPATLDINNKGDITKIRCTDCKNPK